MTMKIPSARSSFLPIVRYARSKYCGSLGWPGWQVTSNMWSAVYKHDTPMKGDRREIQLHQKLIDDSWTQFRIKRNQMHPHVIWDRSGENDAWMTTWICYQHQHQHQMRDHSSLTIELGQRKHDTFFHGTEHDALHLPDMTMFCSSSPLGIASHNDASDPSSDCNMSYLVGNLHRCTPFPTIFHLCLLPPTCLEQVVYAYCLRQRSTLRNGNLRFEQFRGGPFRVTNCCAHDRSKLWNASEEVKEPQTPGSTRCIW